MREIAVPAATVFFCTVSLLLMLKDTARHAQQKRIPEGHILGQDTPEGNIPGGHAQEKDIPEKNAPARELFGSGKKSARGMWSYSAVMIPVTIGLSVLFASYDGDISLWTCLKRMALLSVLWPLAYIDYTTYRIPNSFILQGLACRAAILPFEIFYAASSLRETLLSEVLAAGVLLLASVLCLLLKRNSIGAGDMKLFLVMGLLLGMDAMWGAVFLSLIASFIASVYLLITKKKTRKGVIPFGPALAVGTYLSMCFTLI